MRWLAAVIKRVSKASSVAGKAFCPVCSHTLTSSSVVRSPNATGSAFRQRIAWGARVAVVDIPSGLQAAIEAARIAVTRFSLGHLRLRKKWRPYSEERKGGRNAPGLDPGADATNALAGTATSCWRYCR